MSESVAFLVEDLSASQANFFLIHSLNDWVKKGREGMVFARKFHPPCAKPNFAVFSLADFFGFHGTAVATTFDTASLLVKVHGPRRKALYMQDLDWHRRPGSFDEWRGVYGDPGLRLFARGEDHARVAARAWNKPAIPLTDFDIPLILEHLG